MKRFLDFIWQLSAPGFVFLPTRNAATGAWHEGEGIPVSEVNPNLTPDIPGFDQYFTPATYTEPIRRKDLTAPLGVVYADLDDKWDDAALATVLPTLVWETSPGQLQAIWALDQPYNPYEVFDLARDLGHYLDADHGSGIPTKLLRIPKSVNWKRGGLAGEVLEFDPDRKYPLEALRKAVPIVEPNISPGSPPPPIPALDEHRAILTYYWPKLPHHVKQGLTVGRVADRSLALTRLAKDMATISIPPHDVFAILSRLAINKFRNRPDVLWNSVVLSAYD